MDYLPPFARAKSSLLNNEFKSHYAKSLKWAFDAYPRGALNRNFLPGTHIGVGIDQCSAYPATLYNLSNVPVFTLADEFVVYCGELLVDNAIYIVENQSLTSVVHWLILNAKWNLVSGHTLKRGRLPASDGRFTRGSSPSIAPRTRFLLCSMMSFVASRRNSPDFGCKEDAESPYRAYGQAQRPTGAGTLDDLLRGGSLTSGESVRHLPLRRWLCRTYPQ